MSKRGVRRTEIVFVTRHLVKITRYFRGPGERTYNATPASWARLGKIIGSQNAEHRRNNSSEHELYTWIRRRKATLAATRVAATLTPGPLEAARDALVAAAVEWRTARNNWLAAIETDLPETEHMDFTVREHDAAHVLQLAVAAYLAAQPEPAAVTPATSAAQRQQQRRGR